ncbi:MAG TPA: Ni/Fe-hydrogenase, b-type cytochrome subunit [Bryobacteraceae bacterium]|nr:Ni/Fe-hydrogenase, b-type cytochrome subunit [Bryobacteraceae bacterium]
MATLTTAFSREVRYGRRYVWELPVRISHWINVLTIALMFLTGLYITFPQLAPAGEPYNHFVMGRVRQIHFGAGMVFLFSFLIRVYWFYVGNNYARSGFPFIWRASWWTDLLRQVRDYLRLERGHVHLGHNALAGLIYTIFVIGLGWVQIITGFALYSEDNPGGFWDHALGWVIPLMGGSYRVHLWHHMFAWGFLVFFVLHIYVVLFDSHQYRNGLISSIVSGFKFWEEGDIDHDRWVS